MLNMSDIMETITMIQEENLDIRTITMGISLADCADGQWYSDAVLWASQNEIVTGRSDTVFDPFANLNRQEMAAVLYRYAVYGGAEEVTEPELAYSDAANIADWAEAAVAWCGENEIMKGVSASEFAPWSSADRATGAVVLARIAA